MTWGAAMLVVMYERRGENQKAERWEKKRRGRKGNDKMFKRNPGAVHSEADELLSAEAQSVGEKRWRLWVCCGYRGKSTVIATSWFVRDHTKSGATDYHMRLYQRFFAL